jgi:ribose/xylose/arabinose/galactoside ABC-type transport system permease subunit
LKKFNFGTVGQTEQQKSKLIHKLFRTREFSLLIVITLVFIVLAILKTDSFLKWKNFEAISNGMVFDLAIVSGMTIVLILWGIDLSVGSVLALTSVLTAMMLRGGVPIFLSVMLGLGAAAACGAVNGFLISRYRIAPFIVTLGMYSIARGLAVVLTSGYYLASLPKAFVTVGRSKLLGVPLSIIIIVLLLVVLGVLLKHNRFFSQMYFVGNNPNAAELSGHDVKQVLFFGYVISSLMAGVAGILMTSRLAMGFSGFGQLAELRAIAAAVIGGASFSGGEGSIIGAALGVILLALINNGFVLLNGPPDWQQAVSGIILLVAVGVDAYRRRKERRE